MYFHLPENVLVQAPRQSLEHKESIAMDLSQALSKRCFQYGVKERLSRVVKAEKRSNVGMPVEHYSPGTVDIHKATHTRQSLTHIGHSQAEAFPEIVQVPCRVSSHQYPASSTNVRYEQSRQCQNH